MTDKYHWTIAGYWCELQRTRWSSMTSQAWHVAFYCRMLSQHFPFWGWTLDGWWFQSSHVSLGNINTFRYEQLDGITNPTWRSLKKCCQEYIYIYIIIQWGTSHLVCHLLHMLTYGHIGWWTGQKQKWSHGVTWRNATRPVLVPQK